MTLYAKKDFELNEYDSNNQGSGTNQTLISAKNEIESETVVHGFVVRKSGDDIQLAASSDGLKNVTINRNYREVQSLKIKRIEGKLYYSFNGENLTFLLDMNDFDNYFDVPVTFGAALNYNNEPFRFIKAAISNMYIKLGINDEY